MANQIASTASATASADTTTGNTNENVIMEKDCMVCAEKYNNSTHKAILCEFGDCNFSACKACVRTYLLNTTTDPHCMQCKKVWTEQFIVMNLNRSFVIAEYKTHRRTLLLDREICKLPETMHLAERYKRIDVQKEISSDINAKIKEARTLLDKLNNDLYDSNRRIHLILNGKDAPAETERKKFIMPCPNNDCRGYLSSQYKCELCTLYTCSACHELIGYKKDDPHTCKEENVQSAELIKKETKPCPTCGTRISKISGCDQMWCPECHKAFSWRTGLVDNGTIHNPHFYQYQRDNAGGQAPPRNPGDIVCGGLCEWHIFNNHILRKIKSGTLIQGTAIELRSRLSDIHRCIAHITRVELEQTRMRVREYSDFEDMRCRYILNKITKDELAKTIYRNDSLRKKLTEMLHLYELLSVVGTEFFAKLLDNNTVLDEYIKIVIERMEEYDTLREYCNKQFKTISLTYNQTVPSISKSWAISSKKYTFTKKKAPAVAPTEASTEANTE
jgi:hypothetical protein